MSNFSIIAKIIMSAAKDYFELLSYYKLFLAVNYFL